GPHMEQLEGIMLSPAFQEQMNALMLDPRMLDMMIDQNPQLRNMGPEARQMLRPMFREMMSNPESMRSMMNMGRAWGSKKILIVESDTALSATLRSALEGRGFTVDETTDGKGSVEQIRRDRPDLVVLAVDLSAGQNGYLICGKLKKDDDLKNVPIVIIGNPDGFAQHRKLKAHADEYVAKPVDADQLVERAGALIGFPEGNSMMIALGVACAIALAIAAVYF
uniref:Ubiquitin-domain-containing protein,Response regulator FrzS,Vesicle-associated membrane protein 2 n=1 Tax=Myxococcus xanthus TaxID=34 RepID=UPI003AFB82B7